MITPQQRELAAGLCDLPLTADQRMYVAQEAARIYAPEDAQLVDEVRQFIRRAMDEANNILDRGTPTLKVRLISSVFGRLVGLVGQEQPNDLGKMKTDMAELIHLVRGTAEEG